MKFCNNAIVKSFVTFFVVLAALSLVLGVAVNAFREKPLGLLYKSKAERLAEAIERIQASEAKTTDEPTTILDHVQMKEIVGSSEVVILDARPELFYQLGHIHGALNLPHDDFEKAYIAIRKILDADKNRLVVVYCADSKCEDSKLVIDALKRLGHTRIAIYIGGWREWEKEGEHAILQ